MDINPVRSRRQILRGRTGISFSPSSATAQRTAHKHAKSYIIFPLFTLKNR